MTIRFQMEFVDVALYSRSGLTVRSRSLSAPVARMATPPTAVLALLFAACAGTGQSSRSGDPATRIRRELVDQHLVELVAKFDQALAAHEADDFPTLQRIRRTDFCELARSLATAGGAPGQVHAVDAACRHLSQLPARRAPRVPGGEAHRLGTQEAQIRPATSCPVIYVPPSEDKPIDPKGKGSATKNAKDSRSASPGSQPTSSTSKTCRDLRKHYGPIPAESCGPGWVCTDAIVSGCGYSTETCVSQSDQGWNAIRQTISDQFDQACGCKEVRVWAKPHPKGKPCLQDATLNELSLRTKSLLAEQQRGEIRAAKAALAADTTYLVTQILEAKSTESCTWDVHDIPRTSSEESGALDEPPFDRCAPCFLSVVKNPMRKVSGEGRQACRVIAYCLARDNLMRKVFDSATPDSYDNFGIAECGEGHQLWNGEDRDKGIESTPACMIQNHPPTVEIPEQHAQRDQPFRFEVSSKAHQANLAESNCFLAKMQLVSVLKDEQHLQQFLSTVRLNAKVVQDTMQRKPVGGRP